MKQSSLEVYFEWLDSLIERNVCEVMRLYVSTTIKCFFFVRRTESLKALNAMDVLLSANTEIYLLFYTSSINLRLTLYVK